MRIAIISETFAKNMGYLQNTLPPALAAAGAEVHLITTRLAPYFRIAEFAQTYGQFVETGGDAEIEDYRGVRVHYLPHRRQFGHVRMQGLGARLAVIRPDIVQVHQAIGWIPLDAAIAKRRLGFKFFSGTNYTKSVFPLANREHSIFDREFLKTMLLRGVPGRFISKASEKCYAATVDCADVATRFFGVERAKVDICPLGVDTTIFFPRRSHTDEQARQHFRAELGVEPSEIMCIYSGRFTEDKNPLLLAQAVVKLRQEGRPVRGLFVGNGPQVTAIAACDGCIVRAFVPVTELGNVFRASDIGVWPTQESMSMLDAAACGLPIVVNDTIAALERVEGNGITYRLNDLDDLVGKLRNLQSADRREALGRIGATKMAGQFSWNSIAARRMRDYHAALATR